jgi:hypothetical protein
MLQIFRNIVVSVHLVEEAMLHAHYEYIDLSKHLPTIRRGLPIFKTKFFLIFFNKLSIRESQISVLSEYRIFKLTQIF